jgi:hypothetical protein
MTLKLDKLQTGTQGLTPVSIVIDDQSLERRLVRNSTVGYAHGGVRALSGF